MGKVVYGGGGITPDVFVPMDTVGHSHYLTEVLYAGLVNDFAFEYADKNRRKLNGYKTVEKFNKEFEVSASLLDEFVAYAEKNKIQKKEKQIKASSSVLKNELKALIARTIWNSDGYYPILQNQDNVLKKAIQLMK